MRATEQEARPKGKRAPGSRLTQEEVDEIFRRFHAADPHPKTELHYQDPFTLLVAVVLSAQATDASVNRATPELFRVADTPEKLVELGEAALTEKIKTIGLYRSKARNLIALSKKLVEEHGSKVPESREVLESLPGVGRKTANVVLNVAFGAKTIAIDTHAFRVANRTGLAPGKTPLKVEETLESNRARPLQAQRPSLVDPAWALCVQSTQAGMLALPHRRHLPVQAEDARARINHIPFTGIEPNFGKLRWQRTSLHTDSRHDQNSPRSRLGRRLLDLCPRRAGEAASAVGRPVRLWDRRRKAHRQGGLRASLEAAQGRPWRMEPR